uniref:Cyclin D binding myb like transcription factor 1 n=1 Tax=Capra hircus TaxID=9925 RepID=A0A8C2RV00_CAPHI
NLESVLFIVLVLTTASADSAAATVDSETITLNSGTLQTFEILPSFHLQPTGTPGTYLLQTSSSQGLPLTLTASPTVTLAAAAPASPEQIIVHALSDLGSPTIEEQVHQTTIDDETILIVPSPHGFIQTSDVIDTESVLPLTTLTDPILQHHQEESNIIGSSLGSPVSEDSKDVEDLVHCH